MATLEAWLQSIKRGFGSDSAVYQLRGYPDSKVIYVNVGWAILCPYVTTVFMDGVKIAEFNDRRYVQPGETLSRLGYEVHGLVDFASTFRPRALASSGWTDARAKCPEDERTVIIATKDYVSTGNYFANGDVWEVGGGYSVEVTDWMDFPENPNLEEAVDKVELIGEEET